MNTNLHPTYRADVDGLRAVAILSVLLFHAFPAWIGGGFVGVDVFFVISGFLITSIILMKLDRDSFSFTEFYARRIKRLYPALLLVLLFCLVYGYFVLFSQEFKQLGKQVFASSLFVNNFVLYKEVGYFDGSSDYKPLLHLWSLGIEEQFYIVWPFLLYFAKKRKFPIATLIISGVAGSFFLNVLFVAKKSAFTFYLPHSRFWELLMGSGLAYILLYKKDQLEDRLRQITGLLRLKNVGNLRHLMSFVGIFLILMAAGFLTRTMHFPGWWALLPTIGSFLVILAGPHSWLNAKVLSSRLFVAIGLISYPLYLWHWPLLSFARIVEPQGLPALTVTVALVASFVLSILTYKLFETPVRKQGSFSAVPLLSGMMPLAICGFLCFKSYIPAAIETHPEVAEIAKAVGEWDYPSSDLKSFRYKGVKFFAQGEGDEKILFFGDSNMEHYYPRVKKLMKENRIPSKSVVFATRGGCPPIPNVFEDAHPDNVGFADTVIDYAKDPSIKTVVVGAQWVGYLTSEAYYYEKGSVKGFLNERSIGFEKAYEELSAMLRGFVQSGKKVYLILNTPTGQELCPKAMIQRTYLGQWKTTITHKNKADWIKTSGKVIERLRKTAEDAGAIVIDPVDFLCDDQRCFSLTSEGSPMYGDGAHLRPTYVADHVHFLDRIMVPAGN